MVRKIPLQNGEFALVDDEDFLICSQYIWRKTSLLTISAIINGKSKTMSEHLMNPQKEEMVIHENGDIYDYTKDNLKIISEKDGIKTREKPNKNGFRGVYQPNKNKNKYGARISFKGREFYIGIFDTKEQAAKAYDKKAHELHGDKAILNFPESREEYKKQLNS
ncbi:hypothetical protein [Oceanobacillus locisalsi]|uniref:AP2/ERF domain-containing protein n=1 Tax=Oceanobacillus locisalsi TaxID=546107 RepID=A0ABW3NIC7_9BACI